MKYLVLPSLNGENKRGILPPCWSPMGENGDCPSIFNTCPKVSGGCCIPTGAGSRPKAFLGNQK